VCLLMLHNIWNCAFILFSRLALSISAFLVWRIKAFRWFFFSQFFFLLPAVIIVTVFFRTASGASSVMNARFNVFSKELSLVLRCLFFGREECSFSHARNGRWFVISRLCQWDMLVLMHRTVFRCYFLSSLLFAFSFLSKQIYNVAKRIGRQRSDVQLERVWYS